MTLSRPITLLVAIAALATASPALADHGDDRDAPQLAAIVPSVASRGDVVTVLGHGLPPFDTSVSVGGVPAHVLLATGFSVTFRVPASAGPGSVPVTVTRIDGHRVHSASIGLRVRFDGRVTPQVDPAHAVTATIGRDGGTISAGSTTLTVPAGALTDPIAITLDTAHGPRGLAVRGRGQGARFAPDGLLFLKPAILSFPIPAGYGPTDAHGFGFTGDGSDLHLTPPRFVGNRVELDVWHFSGAGGSFGPFVNGSPTWVPGTAETSAEQQIALAIAPCQGQPALVCNPTVESQVRLALDGWYQASVRPGLAASTGAPSFQVEQAMHEWLEWQAQVQEYLPTPTDMGFVAADMRDARTLATNSIGNLAVRRLQNCTGTDIPTQLHDVERVADYVSNGRST